MMKLSRLNEMLTTVNYQIEEFKKHGHYLMAEMAIEYRNKLSIFSIELKNE